MKTTAAALRELQDYWETLSPKPNVKEIAHMAGMSYSTAARYLNGTTRQGLPDSVRALARALDREDIMSDVAAPIPTGETASWWVYEIQRQMREDNLEELERERALRKDSEARFERTLVGKDEHIAQLVSRIGKLEEEKGAAHEQLAEIRNQKSKYEKVALALLLALGLYFIVFDLPHPEYGITEVLLDILSKLK